MGISPLRVDAFLCTCSRDEMRFGLALATLARLAMSPMLNLKVIRTPMARLDPDDAYTVDCSDLEFRVKRRQTAEELAATPIYLVADDDILPFDNDWAEKGLDVMERNSIYKSVMYKPIGINYANHAYGGNDEIEEYDEVGGLWFMRKGTVTEWPTEYTPEMGWSAYWETKIIHGQGGKTGIFKNLRCNHLGLGFSTLFWNENGYGPIPIP